MVKSKLIQTNKINFIKIQISWKPDGAFVVTGGHDIDKGQSQPLLIFIAVAAVKFKLIQASKIYFLKIQTLNIKPEMLINPVKTSLNIQIKLVSFLLHRKFINT